MEDMHNRLREVFRRFGFTNDMLTPPYSWFAKEVGITYITAMKIIRSEQAKMRSPTILKINAWLEKKEKELAERDKQSN